jgi:hypothetical protein
MVQGIGSAWCRRIVPGRLVCECSEGEGIWIEKGRRKSPWFMLRSGCGIQVFDIFMAQAVMPTKTILVWINLILGRAKARRVSYLSGCGPPVIASPSEVFPELDPAWEVAVPTSGKF